MCTLKYPFNGDTKEELSENIINGNFKQITNYSIGLISILNKLLVTDPEKRPNMHQIFEM
jgi:serine/threonine protein kinase